MAYMTQESMTGFTNVISTAIYGLEQNPNRPVRIVSLDDRIAVPVARILKQVGLIPGQCRWTWIHDSIYGHLEAMDLLGNNGEWPDMNGIPANHTNTVWVYAADFRRQRKARKQLVTA